MIKVLKDHPIFTIIGAVGAIAGIVIGILSLTEPKYALVIDGDICGYSERTETTQPHQWNECENPNVVTGYRHTEEVSQSSGWVSGGKDPNWHCTNIKRAKEAAVGESIHWSSTRTSEQRKKTWDGKAKYKYHCTVTANWAPIYAVQRWQGCGDAPPLVTTVSEAQSCFDKTQRIGWKWKWE